MKFKIGDTVTIKQLTIKDIYHPLYIPDDMTKCEASPSKPHLDGASITGSAFQPLPGIDSFSHHKV